MEALVVWLLDHPDVQVPDVSDAESATSDDLSDEELHDEVSERFYLRCMIVMLLWLWK